MDLRNKVSIVTGGGSGIGRAIALKLASLGSVVVVLDVSDQGGAETINMIRSAGGTAEFVHVDVSKEDDIAKAASYVKERFGGADVLINNAGIEPPHKSLLDLSSEEYDRVMNINLKGAWLMIKYVVPLMISRGGGSIVNIASVAGIRPLAYAMPYSVSKAGLIMLTMVAAAELAKYKVRVNAVAPGWVKTSMVERAARSAYGLSLEDFEKATSQRIVLGRFASPDEIANVVAFLASDESSYMTGSVVVVDGGITLT